MKASELFQRVVAGEFFLVGEFRGGQAAVSSYVDRKTGKAISRLMVTYLVECRISGSFDFVKVSGNAPDGVSEPAAVMIDLERGRRYAFPIESLNKERGLISAWLGKAEPVLVEED